MADTLADYMTELNYNRGFFYSDLWNSLVLNLLFLKIWKRYILSSLLMLLEKAIVFVVGKNVQPSQMFVN